jgi:hypothetical protein
VHRRRNLLSAGLLAVGLLACGSVDVGGLGEGGGDSGARDAAAGASAGGAGGAGGTTPGTGGSPVPAAPGLILHRARFVDGFEGSDWQCNANLCLRGRITP